MRVLPPCEFFIWIHAPAVPKLVESWRVVVAAPSMRTSAVLCSGVVEPTAKNLLTVVVARLDVAATENTVPTAARPPMLKLVVVASVVTNLVANNEVEVALVLVLNAMSSHVIVEVALFASIPPVNCASPEMASDVDVALVAVNLVAKSEVDVALLTIRVPSVAMLVLMVVAAPTKETTENTPTATAITITKLFFINEDSLFITTITMLN